jgi:hypothetical protein
VSDKQLWGSDRSTSEIGIALAALTALLVTGIVATLMYAFRAADAATGISIFSAGIMVAGACCVVGGLLGFLFGIPRSLQHGDPTESNLSATHPEQLNGGAYGGYRVNTNLEQISDWLTKILVGVGLTQLTSLPLKLQELADYLAPGLGGGEFAHAFTVSATVYFVVCGFLLGYLWSRVSLARAFTLADRGAIEAAAERVERASQQVKRTVEEFKEQSQRDALALGLMQRQLNAGVGAPSPSQEELDQAITAASPAMRAHIYYQAEGVRTTTWRDPATKEQMERTIPIFQALIASDRDGDFHRNLGSLGYALKDQRNPDWVKAEEHLTKAIQIRDVRGETEWFRAYEFVRAICRIKTDDTSEEGRQKILDDLRAAVRGRLASVVSREPITAEWLARNQVSVRDLR